MLNISTTLSRHRLERLFVLAVLFYIVVQGAFPVLERHFYWGEMFVFLSFFFVLRMRFNATGYDKHLLFLVLIWSILFPIYGVIIAKLYWNEVFDSIFLIRHAVFFYYAVFFLFAYKYADWILEYLRRYIWALFIIIPYINLIVWNTTFGIHGLMGPLLMAVALRYPENKRFYYAALGYTLFVFFMGSDGGTTKVLLMSVVLFFVVNAFAHQWKRFIPDITRRLVFYFVAGSCLFLSFYILYLFTDMTTQMALLGENVSSLDEWVKQFHTDLNGLWRPILWGHLMGRFLEHPWGLGLGTPLFERWLDGFVLLHLYKPGENYVQGAHNSFVTFCARLGIPAVTLFGLLFFYTCKLAKDVFAALDFRPLQTAQGRLLTGALFGVIFMTVLSCFNVVLESPLFAAAFWFNFGMFARVFGDASASLKKNELDGS